MPALDNETPKATAKFYSGQLSAVEIVKQYLCKWIPLRRISLQIGVPLQAQLPLNKRHWRGGCGEGFATRVEHLSSNTGSATREEIPTLSTSVFSFIKWASVQMKW